MAGTYRQLPEYGPGLFPLYKNPRGWWLFHDKRDHRWMLSNDFPKLAEDLALISKLAPFPGPESPGFEAVLLVGPQPTH